MLNLFAGNFAQQEPRIVNCSTHYNNLYLMFAVFQYHRKQQAIREKGAESKLPASVYDILPPTTARTDYAAGFQNLTVSYRTVFRWCSNGSKFVTDNSNYVDDDELMLNVLRCHETY